MVCLGLEPGAAGWKAQTNPLSYGGTRLMTSNNGREVVCLLLRYSIIRNVALQKGFASSRRHSSSVTRKNRQMSIKVAQK